MHKIRSDDSDLLLLTASYMRLLVVCISEILMISTNLFMHDAIKSQFAFLN